MREITIYQAYDGKVFTDKQECESYEEYVFDMLCEITSKIKFIYTNPNHTYQISYGDLISRLDMFTSQMDECQEIFVLRDVSNTAMMWIYNITGIDFPDKEGHYKYNYNTNQWEEI